MVTQNPDSNIPHMSAILHNKLGMNKDCMTFDISQGCSGYCHALEIIKDIMISRNIQKSLIFTCDLYSKIIDMNNRNVNMIFGDAATVTLLDKEVGRYAIVDSNFGTLPESNDCLKIINNKLEMNGNQVFNYACKEIPNSIKQLLDKRSLGIEDIDCFLLHQGTKFMVEFIRKLLKLPEEKAKFSAIDIGNTVSSSIPIQLIEKFKEYHKKDYIILSGFGVGFTWGNVLIKKESEE